MVAENARTPDGPRPASGQRATFDAWTYLVSLVGARADSRGKVGFSSGYLLEYLRFFPTKFVEYTDFRKL